jgi:hypothetical protein
MPLVAKRKLSETWRDAVASRARELARSEDWLSVFEAHLRDGADEVEAAYKTLAQFGGLFFVPDGPSPGRREQI